MTTLQFGDDQQSPSPRKSRPAPHEAGQWLSRFTATAAGVFVGGAMLLIALYFLVSHQINKSLANFERGAIERIEPRSPKK